MILRVFLLILIINFLHLNAITDPEKKAYLIALYRSDLQSVKKIADKFGVNIILNGTEEMPLHKAAFVGNLDIIKYLLSKGADTNATTFFDYIPHEIAIENGHLEASELLKPTGSVKQKTLMDRYKKHYLGAIWLGDLELVKRWSDKVGVNDTLDEYKQTPLHVAAAFGRKDIIKYLLSKGADINAKITDGRTAYQLALDQGHPQAAELLESGTFEDQKLTNLNNDLLALIVSL